MASGGRCGVVGVTLNFSFTPGFSEHTIHIRGSLAAATIDFERNTYLLHRHTPAGLDFDRYHMSIAEAKLLEKPGSPHAGPCDLFQVSAEGGWPIWPDHRRGNAVFLRRVTRFTRLSSLSRASS